jgi:hypothetical protein
MRYPLIVVLVLLLQGPVLAWSTKEHILLTQLAAARLLADETTPAAMKEWLREVTPGLPDEAAMREWYLHSRQGIFPRDVDGVAYWSVVPDLEALTSRPSEVVAPYPVGERLLHYIDLEFFDPNQQGVEKPDYKRDGSAKPALEQIPRDYNDPRYKQAGLLPFRIEEMQRKLTESIRAGRLTDKPGQFPRDDHAARWAGFVAHYIADNTQPHHASVDYKSRSFFPEPGRAPDVHSQMEYKLVDDEHADYLETRRQVWDLLQEQLKVVKDEAGVEDVWVGSVRTSMRAYDALPLIGEAALAAWKKDAASGNPREQGVIDTPTFYAFTGTYNGRNASVAEVKAELQALAVIRIEQHWRKAWADATADE